MLYIPQNTICFDNTWCCCHYT